jgi:hypothetical protein
MRIIHEVLERMRLLNLSVEALLEEYHQNRAAFLKRVAQFVKDRGEFSDDVRSFRQAIRPAFENREANLVFEALDENPLFPDQELSEFSQEEKQALREFFHPEHFRPNQPVP